MDHPAQIHADHSDPADPPLYANFPRRLDALSIDTIVLVAFSLLIFSLVTLVERVDAARIALWIGWLFVLLFYEPVLVWRLGGSIGHRVMNLRVVDNRTNRSLPLWRALARVLLKGLLGILSFFSMHFSRRHQAVHDILTNSSVRIRDPAKARPHHYTVGRTK